jgi:primosomal protein N' (replication factor Y)
MSPMQPNLFHEADAPTALASGLFAEIVFDRPLDHAYTYAVPEELRTTVAIGKRVHAPFGRGDKKTVGFCVGLTPTAPERSVKSLSRVLDEEPLLTENLLQLTRWMADYYLCGWGQVLNAVVPAGAKEQAGTRVATFIEAVAEEEVPRPTQPLTTKQEAVLARLRVLGKAVEPRRLAKLALCGAVPIEALVAKGYARQVVRRVDHFAPKLEDEEPAEEAITLNANQLRVWAPVEQSLREGGFRPFLLYGVTGSGKTEIYLRAIEEVLRQGKQAIVLVPEISLTPQTIQRFRGRCGEVAVLHSHLGDAERGSHWRRVASGQVSVVVGARSAVFAPVKNLGLIVIDEEHETTFKQETTPRYHARDVAVMRARLADIPILLGSATPSLESWHNAQRGQYTLLSLPNRILDRPLPQVALIDLRNQPPGRAYRHALSAEMERAMKEALHAGGQVMLLLNRRGFSTHVYCPACGHVETCRFCDLALTYHKDGDAMLCHFCGYQHPPTNRCPKCGLEQIRFQGLGTEKLQAEIEAKFPGLVVRRMDSDTMKKPGSHRRVLTAFREGLIHILLGTQMIAKGLDFPNVTLVGVVNADVGLHIPDFRSAERTFQLLAQVAGRTGRGPRGGQVLVQTFNPEQPCIALATVHAYEQFATEELVHRRLHNYPPYHRLARLIVRSRDQQAAAAFADRMGAAFQTALTKLVESDATCREVRLLGPAEAPVFRLKGYFRFHVQLQSPSPGTLHRLLRSVMPELRPTTGVEYTVDVDPFNML